MKTSTYFYFSLLVLTISHSQAQYFLTRSENPLAQLDSFLVRYNIQENSIKSYNFEHLEISEATPLLASKYSQQHESNINLSDFTVFRNDSVQIRACHIKATGARWLTLILKNYQLSSKGKLYFYSDDHLALAGPISSNTNNKVKIFPTASLNDDGIVIVLVEPAEYVAKNSSQFSIKEIWSGQKDREANFIKTNLGPLFYAPNVACYFPQWQYESNAIARMELPDGQCSCTLLNNENNNRTPYVLTGRHCITNSEFDPFNVTSNEINKLNSTSFRFLYRSIDCGGNTLETSYVIAGAAYLDSYFWSDHLLIRLNSPTPAFLNFAGWDHSNHPDFSQFEVTCISHPSGDIQKYAWGSAQSPGTDGRKYSTSWTIGGTQQGSSGSALFDANHKVVGQLSYVTTYDNFGKLSVAWSTPYGGIQSWLSPAQNLLSINPLIPMVIYGPTQLCYGSQGTFTMPNLNANETAAWNVTGNLIIVSSTNNSVTIAPNGPSASGKGTITATVDGYPVTQDLSVGVPDQSTLQVQNNTTGSQNSNVITFCLNQSNNLRVLSIDPVLGGSNAIDAQWIFPNDYSPSTANGTQVQTTPTNMFSNNSFTVQARNNCGWQSYPAGFGINLQQCGGYYSYTVAPNPAKDNMTIQFEKTNESKDFPESFDLYQQDAKGTNSSKPVRSWKTDNEATIQQLKATKTLVMDIKDIPRGVYILQITKQKEKETSKKLDAIRIVLE